MAHERVSVGNGLTAGGEPGVRLVLALLIGSELARGLAATLDLSCPPYPTWRAISACP